MEGKRKLGQNPSESEEDVSIGESIPSKSMTRCGLYSESHADWPQLRNVIKAYLSSSPPPVSILVPACGNSRLSEHMYDAGFTSITNVDFSRLIIADMLERNVRERPLMKWLVADMTKMEQFANETFDAVVDKGGLDGLMNPKLDLVAVTQYLYEVKRLLKFGGKYMCVTFGEINILDILFLKFRYGWKVSLHAIALESWDIKQQAFMMVAEKLVRSEVSHISVSLAEYDPKRHGFIKAAEFYGALERESMIRRGCFDDMDVFTPLEDMILVAKKNFSELEPGRRLKLNIGDFGASRVFYDCILIDAPIAAKPFSHHYFVYIIPNILTLQWLLSPSEGQWMVVKTLKAARVLMVIVETKYASYMSQKDILCDISPLIKQLEPSCGAGLEYPVKAGGDGLRVHEILHQVVSSFSGLLCVDDVIYKEARFPDKYIVRRLNVETFMIVELLWTIEGSIGVSSEVETDTASTSKMKKTKHGFPHSSPSEPHCGACTANINIDHSYLASLHHNAIISGIMLIYVYMGGSTSVEIERKTLVIGRVPVSKVKTVIIGLRAGLLSMFMSKFLPYLNIEVVEKDSLMLDISGEYFGFREDEFLKVHIGDGIEFVREKANSGADGKDPSKIDILIVDWEVPHSRSSQGLTSPPTYFVDESFLLDVKRSLSDKGLFIMNIISWSSDVKGSILSRLKSVFSNVFSIQLVPDMNYVIFALNSASPVNESELSEARNKLALAFDEEEEWGKRVIQASNFIRRLS